MRFRYAILALAALTIIAAPAAAQGRGKAADRPAGFLCCNMLAADREIYDINYEEDDSHIVPFGSPLTVTRQGRRSIRFETGGKRYDFENHYSRDLSEAEFVGRYVVAEDPRVAAAGFPEKIREAIVAGKVSPGMTREQVRMALGWPISSENPDLDAPVWRYWRSSFDEIQVEFGDDGRVVDLTASALTRRKVWLP